MKNILLGITAIAAGAALADIASVNVVGYQKNALNQGGAKMIGVPFSYVGGNAAGFWLSDLTPAGYEENTDLIDNLGTDGDFSVQILDTAGLATDIYSWVRSVKKGTWQNDGHWNDPSFDEVVPHSANDLFIPLGTGLWTTAPDLSGDEDPSTQYTILPAGEVKTNSVELVFPEGAVAFANPFPTTVWLSDLIPTGYEDNADLIENLGTDGDFSLQILDASGLATDTYSWVHSVKKGNWLDDAHWNDPSFDEVIPHGANDLQITPSMGLWMTAPDKSEDDPAAVYSITVNYPGTL